MRLRADEVRAGHRIVGGTVVWTRLTPDGAYVYICAEDLAGSQPRTTTCWLSMDELEVEPPSRP